MSLDDWQADQRRQQRNRRIEIANDWLAEDADWDDIGSVAYRLGVAREVIRTLLEELEADR